MKLNKGLFIAWIMSHLFLLLMNLFVLFFIIKLYDGLKEVNRLGIWVFIWVVFTLVWLFGAWRIKQWYRQGRFHVKK